jgi:hypothetical protein
MCTSRAGLFAHVERSLFRAWLLSVYNDLERTDDTVSH